MLHLILVYIILDPGKISINKGGNIHAFLELTFLCDKTIIETHTVSNTAK